MVLERAGPQLSPDVQIGPRMSRIKDDWWADWRWWAGCLITGLVIAAMQKVLP